MGQAQLFCIAVSLSGRCLVHPEAEGHIGHDVVVIDGDYNPVAEMKGGVISSWPATHAR